jgi:hypothetical protein
VCGIKRLSAEIKSLFFQIFNQNEKTVCRGFLRWGKAVNFEGKFSKVDAVDCFYMGLHEFVFSHGIVSVNFIYKLFFLKCQFILAYRLQRTTKTGIHHRTDSGFVLSYFLNEHAGHTQSQRTEFMPCE